MSSGTIFAGNAIKTLKQNLSLNGVALIGSGSSDPSSAGFAGPVGSIYLRTNGSFYVKTGALDTNWTPAALGGSSTFVDDTFQITDNVDPTKIIKFQASGISPSTTRTYTMPNVSGAVVVGTYASGQPTYWGVSGSGTLYSGPTGANVGNITSNFAGAVRFTASASGLVSSVAIKSDRTGGTAGSVQLEIWSDVASAPGVVLQASTAILASSISGTTQYNTFTFANTLNLTSGNTYFLVVRGIGLDGSFNWYETYFPATNPLFYATPYPSFSGAGSINGWDFTIQSSVTDLELKSEPAVSPIRGGTGVVNNAANTITFTGNFSLGLTLSANTSVTLPTTGTLATLAGSEALSNKTITSSNATLTRMTISSGFGGSNGFVNLQAQSGALSNPASGVHLAADSSSRFFIQDTGGRIAAFSTTSIVGSQLYTFPNLSGTLALTDANQNISGTFTFTSSAPILNSGLRFGTSSNYVGFDVAGSPTTYSVNLPLTGPAALGDILTLSNGSDLAWASAGEVTGTAGENLSTGDLVYISRGSGNGDTGRTAGYLYKVDATNVQRVNCIGVAAVGAFALATAKIRTTGVQSLYSGLTVGSPVYASVTTPGGTQLTAPAGAGQYIIQIGVATSTSVIAINPMSPVAVGSGATTFSDSTFEIFDNGDNSKKLKFEVSGIQASTTRTLTAQDASGTIALLDATQTFSGALTFSNAIGPYFNNGVRFGTSSNFAAVIPAVSIPTSYTVSWPSAAPTAGAGEALTHIGSNLLGWQYPGETGYTAGENLAVGDVLYISKGNANGDTGRTQGLAYKADATNEHRVDVVGAAINAVSASSTVRIRKIGLQDGHSGLTVGQPVYLSVTTPGRVQVSAPTAATQWIVPVGVASSATAFEVNPGAFAAAIFIEDSSAQTATIANNQGSPANVTGMILNGAAYNGAIINYNVLRTTSSTQVSETGSIRATYLPNTTTWQIDNTSVADAGVTFTINSSGQILYTSTNLAGTGYVGQIKWNLETIG